MIVLIVMVMIMMLMVVMLVAVIMVVMVMVMVIMLMFMMIVAVIVVSMVMIMRLMGMTLMGTYLVIMVLGIDGVLVSLMRLRGLRLGAGALDHLALDAVAMAAAAGIAMARATAVAAVLVLFLGLAVSAFIGLYQRLTVGDRDLVVVRMDFAESQEAVTVAAIFDEGSLQRRLDARDLGEVNVTAQLLALGGLEVKLFDAIATDHNDPGLFRVGGIDQHLVGHFGALDGGGRGAWRAQIAPPGDATVHLIRG